MYINFIIGLLFILLSCAGPQERAKKEVMSESNPIKSGLSIDFDVQKGITYTDSFGIKYNLMCMPVTITNDSTIPVHIELKFLNEYLYTGPHGQQNFNIFPMLGQIVLDDNQAADSSIQALPKYIENPELLETLMPGTKYDFSIVTRYQPINYGPLPNALFFATEKINYVQCLPVTEKKNEPNSNLELFLKLDYYHWTQPPDSCEILQCGYIYYSK